MNTNDIQAQGRVLAWAGYADSVDKVAFLKAFAMTMNSEEISAIKIVLGHRLRNDSTKKRKWVGPKWEEVKAAKASKQILEVSSPESSPPSESRPGVIGPWWKQFQKANVVALDVEKINLRNLTGVDRVKPGILAVVNSDKQPILEKTVFRQPGTFLDGPLDYAVSGIKRFALQRGEKWDDVKKEVKVSVNNKLIITVAGQNDLTCMEIERDDYADTFDLQEFYRRPHPQQSDATQEMGLRDIYFYHFKEDCQFKKPHTALTDAICTMKCFLEGYIPLKLKSGFVDKRGNSEGIDFSGAVRLKRKEKLGQFYCKPTGTFKKNCICDYCTQTYNH